MTIFGHRNGSEVYRVFTGVPGGLPEPPRGVIGPHGPIVGRAEAGQGVGRPPLAQTEWARGVVPPFLLSSLSLPLLLVGIGKGGEIYLGEDWRPMARLLPLAGLLLPPPLYMWEGGTPKAHKLIF